MQKVAEKGHASRFHESEIADVVDVPHGVQVVEFHFHGDDQSLAAADDRFGRGGRGAGSDRVSHNCHFSGNSAQEAPTPAAAGSGSAATSSTRARRLIMLKNPIRVIISTTWSEV